MGITKNIQDENSHNGNPGGFSSMAQNADSGIVTFPAEKKM